MSRIISLTRGRLLQTVGNLHLYEFFLPVDVMVGADLSATLLLGEEAEPTEGIVLFQDGERLVLQLFDAIGDVVPSATLVPEKRQELTTEGGLDVRIHQDALAETTEKLQEAGIYVSLFIDPTREAIDRALEEMQGTRPEVWLYRGAWQEWPVTEATWLVPLSQEELALKIQAIFKHQSQKDSAPFPGAHDEREFWQRVEQRNKETAGILDQLGLAEYFAMEAYVVE